MEIRGRYYLVALFVGFRLKNPETHAESNQRIMEYNSETCKPEVHLEYVIDLKYTATGKPVAKGFKTYFTKFDSVTPAKEFIQKEIKKLQISLDNLKKIKA